MSTMNHEYGLVEVNDGIDESTDGVVLPRSSDTLCLLSCLEKFDLKGRLMRKERQDEK